MSDFDDCILARNGYLKTITHAHTNKGFGGWALDYVIWSVGWLIWGRFKRIHAPLSKDIHVFAIPKSATPHSKPLRRHSFHLKAKDQEYKARAVRPQLLLILKALGKY